MSASHADPRRGIIRPPSTSASPRRLLPAEPARILSHEECQSLFKRIVGMTTGGGDTFVRIRSRWNEHIHWGRNRVTEAGTTLERSVSITRIQGSLWTEGSTSALDDASLKATLQDVEEQLHQASATGTMTATPALLGALFGDSGGEVEGPALLAQQQYLQPKLWNDATYQLRIQACSDVARRSVDPVMQAKLLASGSLEVEAVTWSLFNTRGLDAHYAATGGLYRQTVYSDNGGVGRAGLMHTDWTKIDPVALSAKALDDCVKSASPKAVEPGPYTVILKPAATQRFVAPAVDSMHVDMGAYLSQPDNKPKIGQQVFDTRVTITADPADPDCGYIPFDREGYALPPVTWVENGILKTLAYERGYARKNLGTDVPLRNPITCRMRGGDTSLEEMIRTTERGILVSEFDAVENFDGDFGTNLLLTGITTGATWLIERGKISCAITPMRFRESALFVFNKLLQIGPAEPTLGWRFVESHGDDDLPNMPSRALYGGRTPMVVPSIKVQDFNFVSLAGAV